MKICVYYIVSSLLTVMLVFNADAQIRIAEIFKDNMVLQRDQPLKVWGWANKGQRITLSFNGSVKECIADNQGEWTVVLQPMNFGGPFEMNIFSQKDSITLHNILIGDVWICSGQSNMEFPVSGWSKVNNADDEIAKANHPMIRLFTVEHSMSYLPAKDIGPGNWKLCTPETVPPFSAVAYFFGRKLNKDLSIPIGLINANWGGTRIEEWMGWEAIGKLPEFKNLDPKDSVLFEDRMARAKTQYDSACLREAGFLQHWYKEDTDVTDWDSTFVPMNWSQTPWHDATGIIWYRKEFILTAKQAELSASLSLGIMDDRDVPFINGVQVGQTDDWFTPRRYNITHGLLKAGKNTICIMLGNADGGGGFLGNKADISLNFDEGEPVALAGKWLAKPSVLSTWFGPFAKTPNSFPSQLYNSMIAPLNMFSVKGVIWYQGEQNTNTLENARAYQQLFPMLIRNWRHHRDKTLPFLWVQLANFDPGRIDSLQNLWAIVREGQHKALDLPNTGEAIAIDLGESRNIHPSNKQEIGYRLALAGLKVAYNKNIVSSGPVFKSMTSQGQNAILSFSDIGGGLISKGHSNGYLDGFSIAGRDRKFVRAEARIIGNKVIVHSKQIKSPVAVRYGWANDPKGIDLYNQQGLPASPFRTDNW